MQKLWPSYYEPASRDGNTTVINIQKDGLNSWQAGVVHSCLEQAAIFLT